MRRARPLSSIERAINMATMTSQTDGSANPPSASRIGRAVGGHRREPEQHQRGGGQRLDDHADDDAAEDGGGAPTLRRDGVGPRDQIRDDQVESEQGDEPPDANRGGVGAVVAMRATIMDRSADRSIW